MAEFHLSAEADADLENILYYGAMQFGRHQAGRYLDGLRNTFRRIAATPLAYQTANDIRPGYRRAVYQSHSIYYRVELESVLIVRVLGQQDAGATLPPD